jgi:hypothetical protein
VLGLDFTVVQISSELHAIKRLLISKMVLRDSRRLPCPFLAIVWDAVSFGRSGMSVSVHLSAKKNQQSSPDGELRIFRVAGR